MRIALDYDGTFTEDPELWRTLVSHARMRGHEVYVVTMRHEHEGEAVKRQLSLFVDQIVFTGRKAKRRHMDFLGIEIDVWIDDEPHWVYTDAS